MTANNNALVTTSTVDSLAGQLRSHMLGRPLPAPAFVQFDLLGRQVSVHAGGGRRWDLASKLGNLLVWAHSLDEVTAEWWRTSADWLHINVHGRTNGGLRLRIYIGCEFAETAGLVRLDPEESEVVSLDELYALVGPLRATAEHSQEAE